MLKGLQILLHTIYKLICCQSQKKKKKDIYLSSCEIHKHEIHQLYSLSH